MPTQLLRLSTDSFLSDRRWAIGHIKATASWLAAAFLGSAAVAHGENVEQALAYDPIQAGIVYDTPSEADRAKCTIEKEVQPKTDKKPEKVIGFIVKDPSGRMLRHFFDSDGDNKLDTWSYYKDGIEVYREHGLKPKTAKEEVVATEFRWLGENGTRFGLDTNANQKIDEWAAISPEEVSEEFLITVKLKDAERFSALLIRSEEVDSLPISAEMKSAIKTRAEKSKKEFSNYASKQKQIEPTSTWISFGGIKPMTLALTDEGDVTVYENVSVIFDKDGDSKTDKDRADVPLGTLVHIVGKEVDAWRMIDLPEESPFSLSGMRTPARPEESGQPSAGPSADEAEANKHFSKINELESKGQLNPADFATLIKEYEAVLPLVSGEMYENTLIGYGQTLTQGASMDRSGKMLLPDAIERLEALVKTVRDSSHANKMNLAGFLNYNLIEAKQFVAVTKADLINKKTEKDKAHLDAQVDHINALKQHVEDYPEATETGKALNELGLNLEYEGSLEDAKKYYQQCADSFPETVNGRMAAGAVRRFDLVGANVTIKGKTLDNKDWTPKGKPYLVFYYSGQSPGLPAEVKALSEVEAKGKKIDLQIVCVSLDANPADVPKIVKANNIKWPVLLSEGGPEGKLATDMGILHTPYVILVDKNGKGVWHGMSAKEAIGNLPK